MKLGKKNQQYVAKFKNVLGAFSGRHRVTSRRLRDQMPPDWSQWNSEVYFRTIAKYFPQQPAAKNGKRNNFAVFIKRKNGTPSVERDEVPQMRAFFSNEEVEHSRWQLRIRVRDRDSVRDSVRVRVRLFSPLRHLHCAEYRKPLRRARCVRDIVWAGVETMLYRPPAPMHDASVVYTRTELLSRCVL